MDSEIQEEVIHAIPALLLMIGTWIVAGIITYAVSYFDVIVHTNYVLPISAFCWGSNQYSPQGNTDPFCVMEYQILGLQQGDSQHIGTPYWTLLAQFVFVIAIAFTILRGFGSWALHVVTDAPFSWVTAFMLFATFITVWSLLGTAWGDALYYWIQNKPIPSILPWDNNIFFFPFILQYITHDANVTPFDLYISMAIGSTVAVGIWIPLIVYYAKNDEMTYKELL